MPLVIALVYQLLEIYPYTSLSPVQSLDAARSDSQPVEDPLDLPSTVHDSGAAAFARKQDFGAALLRELWAVHGKK